MAEPPLDPKDIALGALANLVRLLGAELVVGRHRDNLGEFERAVRSRIGVHPAVGCLDEVAEAGIALAKAYTELALAQVRAQAAAARAHEIATGDAPTENVEQILH